MMKLRHHPVNPVKIKYDSQNDNQTSNIYEHNRGGSVSSIKETISSSLIFQVVERLNEKRPKECCTSCESLQRQTGHLRQDPSHIVM